MKTKREAPNELTDAEHIWEQKAKDIARRDAMIVGMDSVGMSLKAIATKLAELGYMIGLNRIGRVITAERRAGRSLAASREQG